jgi:uncharacterized membrane protein
MLLRFFGYLFMTLAIAALAFDGTRMLADNGRLVFTSVYQHWTTLSPGSLTWAQNWVSGVSPWLWSPVAMTVLLLPAWFVAVGTGILLYLAGYKPPRPALTDGI